MTKPLASRMTDMYRLTPHLARAAALLVMIVLGSADAAAAPCKISWAIAPEAQTPLPSDTLDLDAVRTFYGAWGESCAWSYEDAAALERAIMRAGEHGLDPELFHGSALLALDQRTDEAATVARDVLLTDAALKYARTMAVGWTGSAPAKEEEAHDQGGYPEQLRRAIDGGDLARWLDGLPPQAIGYKRLKGALAAYRAMDRQGGWEDLEDGPKLVLGLKSKAVEALQNRLKIEGELATIDKPGVFDDATQDALKHYQARVGLPTDGRLGPMTRAALNVSAATRVQQIAANMDRWRASGRDLPPTRVDVNVADATVTYFREERPVLKMKVVVGNQDRHTPMLRSAINVIVVNPTWTVPTSIAERELKPLIDRDPGYLDKHHMSWQGGNIVQEPGPFNALGALKFDFPNPYSVYLHDTPAQAAFSDADRAQSHGCVRLEHPLDMAEALLADQPEWSRERIKEVIKTRETTRVNLSEPVPVILAYYTAFVDDDGAVQFRADVYARDEQLLSALRQTASLDN